MHSLPTVLLRSLSKFCLVALCAGPLLAQDWAVSAAAGPFVFGDFAETKERIRLPGGGEGSEVTHTLSADTRAGFAFGIERSFNQRLSLRLEGTFTEAPLSIKGGPDNDAVSLDIADLSVTTFALPFVFRINRGGRLRPFVFAGPALAMYEMQPNTLTGLVPLFSGTREKWGVVAGGGLEWWWSNRFGVRGSISDLLTESPLERSDFTGPPSSLEIKDVHNLHSNVGIALRF